MKILITGSQGFLGKNLLVELKNRGYKDILEYTKDTDESLLEKYTKECDFVYHLAGINRPKDEKEFMEGNFGFTSQLVEYLNKSNNKAPVLITSSTQANTNNTYGKSKKAGEDLIFDHGQEMRSEALVYRLPNVFGKWCKPNYNSVVATFCYNITHDLPIQINDRDVTMNLVYIDDVIEELINALEDNANKTEVFHEVSVEYKKTLGEIVDLIYSFKKSREDKSIPDMSDDFTKKLYSTYLSYLPEDKFNYALKMNKDTRGSFTEFIKTQDRGQVSINISKPGIIKGNHWHHTKNEKFLVVSGKGIIRFRKIKSEKVLEYLVSGEKLEVLDIPIGYTHNIENLGESDMVTIMWANEPFDSDKPDTYFLEV